MDRDQSKPADRLVPKAEYEPPAITLLGTVEALSAGNQGGFTDINPIGSQ